MNVFHCSVIHSFIQSCHKYVLNTSSMHNGMLSYRKDKVHALDENYVLYEMK